MKRYLRDLKEIPDEIVDLFLLRQKEQTGICTPELLEVGLIGGLAAIKVDWEKTPEKSDFWHKIFVEKRFNGFYKKYPQKNPFYCIPINDKDVFYTKLKVHAIALLNEATRVGYTWGTKPMNENTKFHEKKNVCYRIARRSFGELASYQRDVQHVGYNIIDVEKWLENRIMSDEQLVNNLKTNNDDKKGKIKSESINKGETAVRFPIGRRQGSIGCRPEGNITSYSRSQTRVRRSEISGKVSSY